jgi:PAS domain S-box-containing protein
MAATGRGLNRRWTDEQPAAVRAGAGARKEEPLRWKPFALAAAASAIGLATFFVLGVFAVAGHNVALLVDQAGQGAAALAAALSCGWLALHSAGKIRLAWSLIAVWAFISFAAGAIALAAYELFTGHGAPFPSPADAAFLAGQVVLIAGVLSFPSSPARSSSRWRVMVDGLVIGISLLDIIWMLGLGAMYRSSHVSPLVGLVGLAYPLTDLIAITIMLLILRRAPRVKLGRVGMLTVGLVIKLVADVGFAVSRGAIGGVDSELFDLAWTAGYLFVAMAAWWPVHASQPGEIVDGPTSLWQMLMPWLGLVGVMGVSVSYVVLGRPIDPFVTYPGVSLVVLLMVSQVISYRDILKFLHLSRSAEAAVKARTALLNQVITHAPLGVARISEDFRFIDANPRLGTLLHAPMKVLIGSRVTEFVTRTPTPEVLQQYAGLADGTVDTIEEEWEVRRADGSPTWLHWSMTAVRKSDGSLDYYLAMTEDITARHEAQETAMSNLAGLERLNKMKSEFVSMVSHEFRTALVGIQGFSELIRDDNLEIADIKGLAGDINSDALRLNRMITEMLDLDRMEAGKIRLNPKPVDMNALIRDAVERAQMTAGDQHTVVAELDAAIQLASGDSDRIVQVISNLLSNAVKYSPQGGEIKVSSWQEDNMIHLAVQDHGTGIAPEFISRVFGRYERFDSNRTAKVTGTGLGLAISHQIVELHGGRMWVESEVGKGSTFHFTIPTAAQEALTAG